jgi:hypothetical protein
MSHPVWLTLTIALIWMIGAIIALPWVIGWLRARQRAIDIDILWPSCRDQTDDLDHARAAFAMHAFHDRAWLVLGDDEIARQIERLT